MTRFNAWVVHLANVLVGGTGLVYAVMLYALEPSDPFSVVNHPWQPTVQHLHVWTAPVLVFAIGLIWQTHIWKHWRRGIVERRNTGVSMMAIALPMVMSGYLLQTTVSEIWREIFLWMHLVTSGWWLVAFVVHLLGPDRRNGAAEPKPSRIFRRRGGRG